MNQFDAQIRMIGWNKIWCKDAHSRKYLHLYIYSSVVTITKTYRVLSKQTHIISTTNLTAYTTIGVHDFGN